MTLRYSRVASNRNPVLSLAHAFPFDRREKRKIHVVPFDCQGNLGQVPNPNPRPGKNLSSAHRTADRAHIEQISGDLLAVNQGTLYPLLLKLEQEGAIASESGSSENNRRARFYRLTPVGRGARQGRAPDAGDEVS
jgi:hypothetical protein